MPYRPAVAKDLQWDEVKDFHRYADFPTDPDERMNAITSSLNNGMKALTWSVGLSRSWRTPIQIQAYVRQAVGEGYVVYPGVFQNYVELTMGPVGAVVQANVKKGKREVKAFALTDEGEHFKPVVDYTIKYFVDNDLDFYEVFSTASRGAPKTRIDILKILAEQGEKTEAYIVKELDLSPYAVMIHAESLRDINLIDFESASLHEGKKGFPYILVRPINELRKLGGFNVERIKKSFKKLGCDHKNGKRFTYIEFGESSGHHEVASSSIISLLDKTGFIKPATSFRGRSVRSSLKPNEETKRFYNGWIVPVSKALETGEVSPLITELDRNHYFAVSERFRKTSPSVNKQSKVDRVSELTALIKNAPGLTARALAEKMGLGAARVLQLAGLAMEKNLITSVPSETSENVLCYYPA